MASPSRPRSHEWRHRAPLGARPARSKATVSEPANRKMSAAEIGPRIGTKFRMNATVPRGPRLRELRFALRAIVYPPTVAMRRLFIPPTRAFPNPTQDTHERGRNLDQF